MGEGVGHARAFDYTHAAADVCQIVDEAIRYPGVRDGYVASLEQQAADAVLHDPAQVVTGTMTMLGVYGNNVRSLWL